jgi:hypothetical protein
MSLPLSRAAPLGPSRENATTVHAVAEPHCALWNCLSQGSTLSAHASVAIPRTNPTLEVTMANEKGPNVKKKAKCKNCEGKGLVKKGDKVVKCQRCHGPGLR